MVDQFILRSCIKCNGTDIVKDYKCGDLICRECGEVIAGRIIDEGEEWNIYRDDDRDRGDFVARAGIVKNNYLDCETVMVGGPDQKRQMLTDTQNSLESRRNMKVIKSKDALLILSGNLNLTPSLQTYALDLFCQSIKENVYNHTDCNPLAAATIYISCRVHGYPRLLHEIETISKVNMKTINKWQIEICRTFNIQLPRIQPDRILPRLAKVLFLPSNIIEYSRHTCTMIEQSDVLDVSTPQIIASIALLITIEAYQTKYKHYLSDYTIPLSSKQTATSSSSSSSSSSHTTTTTTVTTTSNSIYESPYTDRSDTSSIITENEDHAYHNARLDRIHLLQKLKSITTQTISKIANISTNSIEKVLQSIRPYKDTWISPFLKSAPDVLLNSIQTHNTLINQITSTDDTYSQGMSKKQKLV